LSSLGFSFARPGFTAGASLSVPMEDQAGAAGAIGAVNGVNVILAPLAVSFYRVSAPGPFVVCAIVLTGLVLYAYLDGTLKRVGAVTPAEEDRLLVTATLERSDEGAGV